MDIEKVNKACSAGASQGSTGVPGSVSSGRLYAFDGPAAAVLDHRGAVVRWTGTAEDLTGFRAEDVCGRPVRELVADLPDDDLRDAEMPASGRVRLWHQCGDTIDVTFRTTKVGAPARPRSSSWRPLPTTSPTTSRAQRSCVRCPHRAG
ncbi:PAS domain-containing protein [Streptomyces kaempferi]